MKSSAAGRPTEPGLHFGFYESPKRIINKARSIGIALDELIQTGALEIIWQPPTENHLDAIGLRGRAAAPGT